MLVAKNGGGERTLARAVARGGAFVCPHCGEGVVLKRGEIVVAHFAHRPRSACHFGAGESERHLLFKERAARGFQRARIGRVEIEWPVGDRIVDIWVETSTGRAAVEFQASAITMGDLLARTRDLASAGASALWILDEGLFGRHEAFASGRSVVCRAPATFRLLQRLYFGRVYVYTAAGKILPVRGERIPPKPRYVLGAAGPLYGRGTPNKWKMKLTVGPRLPSP